MNTGQSFSHEDAFLLKVTIMLLQNLCMIWHNTVADYQTTNGLIISLFYIRIQETPKPRNYHAWNRLLNSPLISFRFIFDMATNITYKCVSSYQLAWVLKTHNSLICMGTYQGSQHSWWGATTLFGSLYIILKQLVSTYLVGWAWTTLTWLRQGRQIHQLYVWRPFVYKNKYDMKKSMAWCNQPLGWSWLKIHKR